MPRKTEDIINKVGSSSINESKLQHNGAVNPPDYAPGMGVEDDIESFFADTSSTGSSPVGDASNSFDTFSNYNNINSTGYSPSSGQFGGFNQPQQPSTGGKLNEEKAWELARLFLFGGYDLLKEIISSFRSSTPKFWTKWGAKTAIVGVVVSVVGFVLFLFSSSAAVDLMVGGLLSTAVGVGVLMFLYDSAKNYSSEYSQGFNNTEPVSQSIDIFDDGSNEAYPPDDYGYEYGGDDEYNTDSDADIDYYDSLYSGASEEEVKFEPKIEKLGNINEAIEEVTVEKKGLVTRQFLFENVYKVLPSLFPNFNKVKEIPEGDLFYAFNHMCTESVKVLTGSSDDLPYLVRASESLFFIKLELKRTKSAKNIDSLCNEVVNFYKDSINALDDDSIYGVSTAVGDKIFIEIFKGESALVSLKDMMTEVKDFILDIENIIPVIIGISHTGAVVVHDFSKLECILVSGMPRSGKSWFVQAILFQMCCWLSPCELAFYICDPKEGISDFRSFTLPHVKKFVYKDNDILNTVRQLVRVEGVRRKKIIGDAGFVNIWDFKKQYPDVELPIIYVVIDEVVTLAERMDKDTKAEFQGLLMELVSQLPAVGIRAFMIPHVVKDQVLKKRMTDLIPCRVSVCGDQGHISDSLGVDKFPYKLSKKGDMAVKLGLGGAKPMFIHGPALTNSNPENNQLFEYLRRLWVKIDPDCEKNSVAEQARIDKETSEWLNNGIKDIQTPVDRSIKKNKNNIWG